MYRYWVIFALFMSVSSEQRKPNIYRVNLDSPPEDRWNEVVNDFKKYIPAIKSELGQYFYYPFQNILCWLCEKLALSFPEEFAREMQGIAKVSGLEYCEIIGLNILYDITNYNNMLVLSSCSSIISEDKKGQIYHGRNLDYIMTDLMKNLSIIVDFTRGGKTVYTALTWAFFTGVITGQKPFLYTLSTNARRTGWYINTILMEIYTAFSLPFPLALRKVMDESQTYHEALDDLKQMYFISPSYIIIGGTKSGEGALVTRDRLGAADVLELEPTKDMWFIAQSNFDHWNPDEDNRRTTAQIVMKEITQNEINDESMMMALSRPPVRNRYTITSTVMSAADPEIFYRTTFITE